jgi:hypothetical protein
MGPAAIMRNHPAAGSQARPLRIRSIFARSRYPESANLDRKDFFKVKPRFWATPRNSPGALSHRALRFTGHVAHVLRITATLITLFAQLAAFTFACNASRRFPFLHWMSALGQKRPCAAQKHVSNRLPTALKATACGIKRLCWRDAPTFKRFVHSTIGPKAAIASSRVGE